MKLAIVAWQLPEPEGTAPGRALLAICEGLLAEGHEVDLLSWRPLPPEGDLPSWCRWEPPRPESFWRIRRRSLLRPRSDVEAVRWVPPDDAIAIADDVMSFAAVRTAPRSVVTLHNAAILEAIAVRRFTPRDVQGIRADLRVARQAALTLAYSERVGRASLTRTVPVPIAFLDPGRVLPALDEPVAGFLADFWWPPNRSALGLLLRAWPDVRAAVPGARLLLAGRNIDKVGIGTMAGVEVMGELPAATDLLEAASVVAFPCPTSSGPKMKVLEAMAYGRPVVTTAGGVEGIFADDGTGAVAASRKGSVVATREGFGAQLAKLLADPVRRQEIGSEGRAAFLSAHAPRAAARLRAAAYRAAFPER